MKILWIGVFLLVEIGFFTRLQAQDSSRFTLQIKDKPFIKLVEAIEASSSYRFYFRNEDVDSIHLQVDVHGWSLYQILTQILKNSSLHFSIDEGNRVFITPFEEIVTTLPEQFFNESFVRVDKSNFPVKTHVDPSFTPKIQTSIENKLFFIGIRNPNDHKVRARIAGYIKDFRSGEGMLGASISWDNQRQGVIADQYGYYSLSLPLGRHILKINSAGMTETRRQIQLNNDGRLDIFLQEFVSTLRTVTITAEKGQNVQSSQMGLNRLTNRQIKQVPVVFGEADIVKVLLTLPGVTSVGEASNGFNVRGGATDQNLILFGDATIYNPSHLFGFFSAFNPELVKGIELYKNSIPPKFGGRISSVLDLSLQEGNKKEWKGNLGIGPVTGKLSLGGPLIRDKTSLILGLRTTYSDWILKALHKNSIRVNNADFSDGSFRISHSVNEKNMVYVLGYFSHDRFRIGPDTLYQYGNLNGNIKWKHNFNNKAFSQVSAGIDHYQYAISSSLNLKTAFDLGFSISQTFLKSDFNYLPNEKHTLSYGLSIIRYQLHPGTYTPTGSSSLVSPNILAREQGYESAIYFGDDLAISPTLLLSGGVRFSIFNYLGPRTLNLYANGLPRDTATRTGIQYFSPGKIIKTYGSPEIRLSMRLTLSESSSLKMGYNTLNQYIHSLSNTVAVSPTDIWKLSDPYIKPQEGSQISLGYFHNFSQNNFETSLEVYYKSLNHYLDYKSGASLLLNSHIETDVINTRGKAYGIEVLIKKNSGKINGWVSYAYSRTFLKQDDPLAGENINKGEFYPASFDKPHNFNFIGNYRFTHRYAMSLNFVYSTGRPITLPLATFILGGAPSLLYSDRNQYRVPDYFRTDLSFTLDGNHKIRQRFHSFWAFGVYNLTGRENAYSNYFTQINGKIQGFQLSIFGAAIPFVTFNLQY